MLPFFPISPIIAYPDIWIEEKKDKGIEREKDKSISR
jgi:hypothetical protein